MLIKSNNRLQDVNNELERFETELAIYASAEQSAIMKAARWSAEMHKHQKRASGDPYFVHPLNVAKTLIKMRMDAPSVIAGLLHDIEEDTDVSQQELKELFGEEVEQLVDGVTKISLAAVRDKKEQTAETIRKIFLAMAKDIRVILIKLADKRHNMGTLQYKNPEKQKATARECLEIYAPLAGKLGIYWLKMEFEDLALKFSDPLSYEKIRRFFEKKSIEQTEFLNIISKPIELSAQENGIDIQIAPIPRNFYALYRKLNSKTNKTRSLIFTFGARILCRTVEDCYKMVGLIHQVCKPLEGRFKDFIALAKDNRYQSLHTTVMGTDGRPLELQIRTYEMDHIAEHGVTAFWMFSGSGAFNPQDIGLIEKIKRWEGLKTEGETFLSSVKGEMLHDSLYVFDKKGQSWDMPEGSTALDFAFRLKDKDALQCSQILIDSEPVPFDFILQSSQAVEIVLSEDAAPSLAWLYAVKSQQAKTLIFNWYKLHGSQPIIYGDIYVAMPNSLNHPNLSVKIASCCQPTRANDIVAFMDGDLLEIHRKDCLAVNSKTKEDGLVLEALWQEKSRFIARYRVTARYQNNLFAQVEESAKECGGQLISGTLRSNQKPGLLEGLFMIEMENNKEQANILKKIGAIEAVIDVEES